MKLKNFFILSFFVAFFISSFGFAQDVSFQQKLTAQIDSLLSAKEFSEAQIGISIYSVEGRKYLYERNSHKLFVPASNLKIITSAGALSRLKPAFTYRTEIYYTGKIVNHNLEGNLIVKGYGDPTLSEHFYKPSILVFEMWADSLRKYGIKKIKGHIIGDDSYFDRVYWAPGWSWDDLSYWYAAEICALSFNDNCVDLYFTPDPQVGGKVKIEYYPKTRYITYENNTETLPAGSKKTLDYYREPFSNHIQFFGALNRSSTPVDTDWVSVHNPALYTVFVFQEVLKKKGIKVTGSPTTYEKIRHNKEKKLLFIWNSPPFSEIIKVINKRSQNFYSEQVLKTLGAVLKAEGSFKAGTNVISEFLTEAGVNPKSYKIYDGSGLSFMNLLSPRAIIKVLDYMTTSPYFDVYYESLAIPGVDKGVDKRMEDVKNRKNARVKTGFIANAIALSGYLKDREDRLYCFSILVNHHMTDTKRVWQFMDEVCKLILDN